ncbi:hypothetical protein [Virgibacillus ndiopensis]|uniref:hypothetical protein n=1 Tax=Virgibacillus ndiopensis TaxID=2004408 RepID=UPI000C073216|nr:hypothetical protein [Virgibacillus ndiopensis]
MAEERIATIVKEINYWKQHKLLPDMYCDYLLALYTNGTGVSENDALVEKRKIKISLIIQIILQFLLVPFSFLVIYFTEFHPIMQLSILFLFVGSSYWQYRSFKLADNILFHLSLIIFLLLILLTSVFISQVLTSVQWLTAMIILLHFIGWVAWSKQKRLLYLRVIGIIGIIFTSFYIVL